MMNSRNQIHHAVQSSQIFNSLEFRGIEIRIINLFPDTQKLNGVFITQPFFDEDKTVLNIPDHKGVFDLYIVFLRAEDDANGGVVLWAAFFVVQEI